MYLYQKNTKNSTNYILEVNGLMYPFKCLNLFCVILGRGRGILGALYTVDDGK